MKNQSEKIAERLLLKNSQGLALCCEFYQEQDRYTHSIYLLLPNHQQQLLLSSCDEGADASWPESPPFQMLLLQEIEAVMRAFPTGAAGENYWSSVISPSVSENDLADKNKTSELPLGFLFDTACRMKGKRGPVQSTYQIAEGVTLLSETSHTIRLGCELGEVQVRVLPVFEQSELEKPSGPDHSLAEDLSKGLDKELYIVSDNMLKTKRFVAAPAAAAFIEGESTVRWKYQILFFPKRE